jgi:hypothetical protein
MAIAAGAAAGVSLGIGSDLILGCIIVGFLLVSFARWIRFPVRGRGKAPFQAWLSEYANPTLTVVLVALLVFPGVWAMAAWFPLRLPVTWSVPLAALISLGAGLGLLRDRALRLTLASIGAEFSLLMLATLVGYVAVTAI